MRSHLSALLLLGLISAAVPVGAQQVSDPDASVAAAAETWLQLLDGGRFHDSWTQAGSLFQRAVSPEQWEQAVRQARRGMGAPIERKVDRVVHSTSLPGAPAGEYIVVEFRSIYEAHPQAVETVVLRNEGEEGWRVVGSFIRPG